jgi:hypothetical protein
VSYGSTRKWRASGPPDAAQMVMRARHQGRLMNASTLFLLSHVDGAPIQRTSESKSLPPKQWS